MTDFKVGDNVTLKGTIIGLDSISAYVKLVTATDKTITRFVHRSALTKAPDRPIEIGDWVTSNLFPPDKIGQVDALHGGEALIKFLLGHHCLPTYTSCLITDLERIDP